MSETPNGQAVEQDKRLDDESKTLEGVRAERDHYANAAAVSESNELHLFRRLSGYLDAELERKDAEIARLQRRVSEFEGGDGR